MPPLAELSVNRPVKTKQFSLHEANTTSGKRQLPSSALESNASSLPSTSAIQSMLKNTTELGDAGQFAVKPTNVPRYKSSAALHPRPHQHQHQHQQVRRPYDDSPAGSHFSKKRQYQNQHDQRGHSLHHSRSLRTNGGHSLLSDSQGQRPGFVTQSSTNSRRASVHPSLLNLRPDTRAGARPRSPYVYPSRLKRPGHRPSSPVYSEINVSDSAIPTSIYRAYSTRTGSPFSASSPRKIPQIWNHNFNRSDPLLQYYPPGPLCRRHDGNRSPPFLRRAALPGSPLASHRSSFVSKFRNVKQSDSSSSSRRVPSPAPLFYDYSEAFEKESFNHTAQRSSLFEARYIPQSDGSNEGYQADVTTTSTIGTKPSDSSTESEAVTPERIAVKGKGPSPVRFVSQVLKQQPAEHDKASADMRSEPSISSEVVLGQNNVSHKNTFDSTTDKDNMPDLFTSSFAKYDDLQRPSSIYDPAPKIMKTAAATIRLSSSSSGSQYSSSAHSRQEKKTHPSPIKVPEIAYERQPKVLSVSFNRLEMIRHEIEGSEPQQRAASLDTHVRPEPFQIFSPVPERSMSSRDSRDRFSRILSIGEDLGKRDVFTSTLPNKKAPMTIQQYLRDRKPPSHKPRSSITKELPPLPDDPPPMPSKGKEKEVDEPQKDQYAAAQFINVEQLLGQYRDPYSQFGLEHSAAFNDLGRPGIPARYSSVSRNSLLEMPESSRSVRTSTLSQKPISGEQQRRFALTPRNSSLFQTMKELPPLPKEAVVPVPPPQSPSLLELPRLFTPLLQEGRLDTAIVDIKDSPKAESLQPNGEKGRDTKTEQQTPPQSFVGGLPSGPGSTASPASARPWNLDTSYPWAGTPPRLEVSIPQSAIEPASEAEMLPRFRLNIRRASMLGTNGKLSKNRPPNIKVLPSKEHGKEIPSISTRFTEALGSNQNGAPSIALLPPSPGLQIEAQSFFSDDSSQRGQKNSIRRRLSQIRGAMRVASSDDVRVQASPTFGLSRISKGSSSKRSSTAPDVNSPHKFSKWRMIDRIKSWFRRREEKIKKWRRKLSARNYHSRPFGTHLYPEV